MKTTKEEIESLGGKFFVFVHNSDFKISVTKEQVLEFFEHEGGCLTHIEGLLGHYFFVGD